MTTLIIKVKTLTPLIMYRAGKTKPELRASSFRGILRYWYRAVLGNRTQDRSQLFEQESKVFGSTQQGSTITVRINHNLQASPQLLTVLPQRLKHVGFSPGSSFSIRLSVHPLLQTDLFNPNSDFTKAVFLMCHFGGVGYRSRRGSGNLEVVDAAMQLGEYLLGQRYTTHANLKTYLTDIANLVSNVTPPRMSSPPPFSIFTPTTAVVLLGETTHPTYEDAFEELWSVSGPYHNKKGAFGDINPRRASAIHMRVARCQAGYVAQQTILYSGRGNWNEMKLYIEHCQRNGFDVIYGDWRGWR